MKTIITMTESRYDRTDSGKSWRSKPYETRTEIISSETHNRLTCDETMKAFRRAGGSEHADRSYTHAGYLVTRLVSSNPSRTERVTRDFEFTQQDN